MEVPSTAVSEADRRSRSSNDKAKRLEAQALVAAYHQEQLRVLLEHVRSGFDQLDAGEIDEFELDDLIHRYKRATKNLWVFCEAGGGQPFYSADVITQLRERGEERDWWAASARRRERS